MIMWPSKIRCERSTCSSTVSISRSSGSSASSHSTPAELSPRRDAQAFTSMAILIGGDQAHNGNAGRREMVLVGLRQRHAKRLFHQSEPSVVMLLRNPQGERATRNPCVGYRTFVS